jgi:hypothetical protein
MEEYQSLDSGAETGIMAILGTFMIFTLAISVFLIICQWKIFVKAGRPGWACIVPIYGALVFLEIIGKPWWWLLLICIPFVNIIFIIMAMHQLSLSFGQGAMMTILLLFLIGFPILAFGSAQYTGQKPLATQPI